MISHKIIKYTPPPVAQTTYYGQQHAPVTKEELDAWFIRFPFKVGDWLYYPSACMFNGGVTSEKVSVLLSIETDHTKVKRFARDPRPFLLMQLSGTSPMQRDPSYRFDRAPWTRYDDGTNLRVVTEEDKLRINDDYVQNYIQEYLPKAHTLVR